MVGILMGEKMDIIVKEEDEYGCYGDNTEDNSEDEEWE